MVNIDKSGVNQAGLKAFNAASPDRLPPILVRQCEYLNHIVEQDRCFIKKIVRPLLGFEAFNSARVVLGGIGMIHRIRKGQRAPSELGAWKTAAEQFYQLAE